MKALCFGSLNIDYVYEVPHFVQGGETLSSASLTRYCGGKGLNQAIALSRAGMESYMAGAVGQDGAFLLELLRDAGVDTRFVHTGETPTGHAIIQNTPDGENCILLYGGANRTVTQQQAQKVLENFDEGDLLLVQNEISSLREIISLAKARGMMIALNPSPMEAQLKPIPPETLDYLILNRIEAAQLLDLQAHPETLLSRLGERYPASTIVLTLGGEGALLQSKNARFSQPAVLVKPVDTTGAGDTFTGFFLAGLLERGDPAFALSYAATAAAIAITSRGAAPSIPRKEEVISRMNELFAGER